MFNFFRRKRGSLDDLVDLPDKMLDEDVRLPDENQNTDTDCVTDARVGCLMRPESAQSQTGKKNCKKVRWAENMEQFHLESDTSSHVSSSEDEEEEQTVEEEEEDTQSSEEESEEEESSRDEDLEEEEESIQPDQLDINKQTEHIPSPHIEELNQLKNQLGEIDRDMTAKSALIDRLQTELREAYQDAEIAKYKMSNLQLELEETKQNLEQAQNHESETESDDEAERALRDERLKETEERIAHLEEQLKQVIKEKEEVENNLSQIVSDRDQRINEIQRAYDDALREQDEMIAKFEEDFEELRTLHSRREQQLLDDFEWKLREVEKNCKTRVEKKDRAKDHEIAELVCKLAETNVQLQEAKKFEVCKVELEQSLKASTELKRNLRTTNRRLEEVQVNEKVLQEETSRLRTQLDKEKSFVTSLQTVHREELDERERKMNFRLDTQKNLINSEWEERLKRETRQLKQELERRAREETNAAVEQVRKQMDKTITSLRNEQEQKSKTLSLEEVQHKLHILRNQVEELKKRLVAEELEHKEALDNVQSRSDTELIEMRRKMEKLYMSYEDKIEKINEQHEQQINRVQEDCDKRIQQIESNLQMHAGTTRTTVELVKEQLHRDNQVRLQQLENQHQRQLEEQWMRMNRDKEEALRQQESKHKELVKQIQHEMEQLKTYTSKYQQQKDKMNIGQSKDTSPNVSNCNSLQSIPTCPVQSPVSPDRSNTQQSIRAELGEAEASLVREKDRLADLTLKAKMCQTIQQLTLQLESSKKEIESLNSRLRIRGSGANPPVSEAIHPLTPEPPAPPPRSRGRHSAANANNGKIIAQVKDSIPTAKVQPQNFVKDNQLNIQQATEDVASSLTTKIQCESFSQGEERPNPPGIKVQAQPNQQSYNQSRRSRKHRSRRH